MVCQNGNPCHWPMITRPGSTRMTLHSVPAAEAWVWTMLFSRIEACPSSRSNAIEMTAAGMEDEKVIPVFRPM